MITLIGGIKQGVFAALCCASQLILEAPLSRLAHSHCVSVRSAVRSTGIVMCMLNEETHEMGMHGLLFARLAARRYIYMLLEYIVGGEFFTHLRKERFDTAVCFLLLLVTYSDISCYTVAGVDVSLRLVVPSIIGFARARVAAHRLPTRTWSMSPCQWHSN